jgi:hypothetical protein
MPIPSDYDPNIPQASTLLSVSQLDLLNNFGAIQALIDVNHVDFAAGDAGKHKWVTLPLQGAHPPAGSGFAAGELGLYNAAYALTTQNELFINKTNQATVVQVPSTASILSSNSAPAQNSAGWTLLPSGIVLRWGNFTGFTGLATVTLSTSAANGPALTQILTVQVTPYNTSAGDVNFAVRLSNIISPTQFSVYISSRTTTGAALGGFQYLVIGY